MKYYRKYQEKENTENDFLFNNLAKKIVLGYIKYDLR